MQNLLSSNLRRCSLVLSSRSRAHRDPLPPAQLSQVKHPLASLRSDTRPVRRSCRRDRYEVSSKDRCVPSGEFFSFELLGRSLGRFFQIVLRLPLTVPVMTKRTSGSVTILQLPKPRLEVHIQGRPRDLFRVRTRPQPSVDVLDLGHVHHPPLLRNDPPRNLLYDGLQLLPVQLTFQTGVLDLEVGGVEGGRG